MLRMRCSIALVLAAGCAQSTPMDFMGNTNWLHCTRDEDCEGDLCACGVCTLSCEAAADCTGLPDARCESSSSACGETHAAGPTLCLPSSSLDGGLVPLDAGSDAAALATCDELPTTLPQVSVFEADTGILYSPVEDTLEGTVLALGTGSPDDLQAQAFGFLDDTRWVRIEGGGRTWTVLERGVEKPFGVAVDDVVRVTLSQQGGGFSPPRTRLTLERDTAVVYYYELGADLTELVPPRGFQLVPGDLTCRGTDPPCGAFHEMEVTVSDESGIDATLAPGTAATLGGSSVRYLHGRQDEPGTRCADWFASRVELAITAE